MALLGAILLGLAAAWLVPLPERLGLPSSPEVRYADGSVAHVLLSADEKWRVAARLDEVDPDYVAALYVIEDARFRWHPGVDPLAVARAAAQDLAAGRIVSGASTLTMQVARLSEPRPRTFASKGIEALRALQLEARWDKDAILEAYLTFLPFGRNVEGLPAAAWWFFGHGPEELSAPEIATLLAVPQDPTRRHPSPANAARLRAARDGIARRLWAEGSPELAATLAAPVPERIAPPPRATPHAARWMLARSGGEGRVRSTLDRGVSGVAERVLGRAEPGLLAAGIHGAAVVVVEHATGELRALVGGTDFFAAHPGAQLPAFDEPRSPGSTLKPLLYAVGVDEGRLLPDRLLADAPVAYGGYTPENYDGGWAGMVRAEDALSRSLNVPFVNLLSEVGVEPFLGKLRAAGARHLDRRPGHYGLSVVAGGIELTPLEVAGLYAALAGDGTWKALRWRADQPSAGELRLFSPGAAWLTRKALRLRDRPDFPDRSLLARDPPRIHWKTGTSYGNRDAWAVGSGRRYTAAVWLGNLDQAPSPRLVGAEVAAPLLFDLLEGLDDGLDAEDRAPPDLRPVEVCALSGHLPGTLCPERRFVPALAARVPPDRCPLHRPYEVDADTGLRLTAVCSEPHARAQRVGVVWPSGVRRWLGATTPEAAALPPLAPDCAPDATGAGPRVRSPGAGEVIVLYPGVSPEAQQFPLEADAPSGAELAWYVDGVFLARAEASQRAWWTPSPGAHRVSVMDAAGRTDDRVVEVRAEPPVGMDARAAR